MPKQPRASRSTLLEVGREGVATHAELVAAGMPLSTVMYRIAAGGRWQRLLPGVVLMHNGRSTPRERILGALAYAGPRAVLTGATALELRAVREAPKAAVHVLVPHDQHRQNHSFVIVERTRFLPEPDDVVHLRGLPTTALARAVVDACRRLEELNAIRNLVADVVQNHGLPPEDLARAVDGAARQRTAGLRRAVREIDAGVRFAAEVRARGLIIRAGLPMPLFNVELLDDHGMIIAVPDGYYPQWACGYQIDSRRWHMSPSAYERTVANRAFAARFGVLLVPVTPQRVFQQPDAFIADVEGIIKTSRLRDVPAVHYRNRPAA